MYVSQDFELPEQTVGTSSARRSVLNKSGKRSPRAHLDIKIEKIAERFIKIREQLGPSLGVVQVRPNYHRNSIAPTFADGDPKNTLWAQDGERGSLAQLGNKPQNCRHFAERTWKTKLHSSNQRWNEEQHQPQPSVLTMESLWMILVHPCT